MCPAIADAPISRNRRRAITGGLLLGMSLGALEATVVGTAMPTVIAALGGLAHYSWVFSAYLLTSTASVPIWGRMSDLYGRRRIYLIGVTVFLIGSALSGAAGSMTQLILARAVQGIGAGAIIPISQAVVGELYTLRERARTQALFSGVWGVASIAGPLIGGYITDALSWRWVFYINIPAGLLSLIVIAVAYPPSGRTVSARVDWAGAALIFAGISALLYGLSGEEAQLPWLVASAAILLLFVIVERRAAEPIIPLDLIRSGVTAGSFRIVFLAGFALFGAIAFIPLFVQGVMGGTATQAGQVMTPLFLGWVVTSIMSARLAVHIGYRPVAVAGGALMTAGFVGLSLLTADSRLATLFLACFIAGAGMGFQMLALLLAVQHSVERSRLGIATSLNQFARSIGASLGVAVIGAIVSRSVAGASFVAGTERLAGSAAIVFTGPLRDQFAEGLHRGFVAGAIVSLIATIGTLFLPAVDFAPDLRASTGEEMLTAEMATLDSEDEPVGIPDHARDS